MIGGLSVLAVITARGGSKGLPRKNVLPLAGKPLLAWTIDAARQSRYIDRLILSSDDAEIIAAARDNGCEVPFVRPAELAADASASDPVLLHALDQVSGDYDIVVLLQPTSPLRLSADIDGALRHCLDRQAPSCVSVCEPAKSPYWCYSLDSQTRLQPLLPPPPGVHRRQDLPTAYAANGAVYVARVPWFRQTGRLYGPETVGYVMPKERSVDIDCRADFAYAEALLASRQP